MSLDGPERRERNRQQLGLLSRWCATVAAVPALVIAALLVLILGNLVVPILVAIVVYAGLGAWVYLGLRRYGATLLADLAPVPAEGDGYARLHNLADGLCLAHGLPKPELWVIETDSRNIATVLTGERERERESAVIVTSGLLDALSRVELEGVLAQQLSHIRDGDTSLATFVAAMASIPLAGRVLSRRAGACLDPDLETHGDMAAAAMTRYPPGLAGALEKLIGHRTDVPAVTPSGAHLWLADPLVPTSEPTGAPASAGAAAPEGAADDEGQVDDGQVDDGQVDDGQLLDPREPFVPHPSLTDRIALLREL